MSGGRLCGIINSPVNLFGKLLGLVHGQKDPVEGLVQPLLGAGNLVLYLQHDDTVSTSVSPILSLVAGDDVVL
jgi:hypothetical protein